MGDTAITIFLHCSLVAAALGLLSLLTNVDIYWRRVWIALLLYSAYYAILVSGLAVQQHLTMLLNWNWLGKIWGALFTLLCVLYFLKTRPSCGLAEFGLTWRQKPGSLLPCSLVIAVFIVFFSVPLWGASLSIGVETFLFQATMPGIDEELFYRGLFLTLLMTAIRDKSARLFGAEFGWSCWIVTFLFALIHGIHYRQGLEVYSVSLIATFAIGWILVWLRQRSGSLVLPILGHNLWNIIALTRVAG